MFSVTKTLKLKVKCVISVSQHNCLQTGFQSTPLVIYWSDINYPPLTQTLGKATFAVVWQLKHTYRYFDNITDSLCYTF